MPEYCQLFRSIKHTSAFASVDWGSNTLYMSKHVASEEKQTRRNSHSKIEGPDYYGLSEIIYVKINTVE